MNGVIYYEIFLIVFCGVILLIARNGDTKKSSEP